HLAEVRHRLNPDLAVAGILLTMAELHTLDGRATADALRAAAPWPVLEPVVAKRVAYRQAATERVGVEAVDPALGLLWDRIADDVRARPGEVARVWALDQPHRGARRTRPGGGALRRRTGPRGRAPGGARRDVAPQPHGDACDRPKRGAAGRSP